jgi:hypothetical protein
MVMGMQVKLLLIFLKNIWLNECSNKMGKQNLKNKISLPSLVWILLASTGLALFGGFKLLGFNISGIAWIVPLLLSLILLSQRIGKITFPFWIWIPWIVLLISHCILSHYSPLQRTVQVLCPIVIGCAVSTLEINNSQLQFFIKVCKNFAIIIVLIALFKTGFLLTGRIPHITGLAAEVMTGLLLCALFASGYASGDKKQLYWWAFMASLPVFAVTRTAIATAGVTLPFTFAPLGIKKRVLFIIAGLIVGLIIFFSPRIQNKMFYSGQGTIQDMMEGDIATTGRRYMAKRIKNKIYQRPWLGYGTGSGESFTWYITHGSSGYPHNDWLLTLHDQGILGATIYALSVFTALIHSLRMAWRTNGEQRVLFFAGASSFIILIMMMFTDNIMVYASFFGNLQFTMLGLAYAAKASKKNINELKLIKPKRKIVIRW